MSTITETTVELDAVHQQWLDAYRQIKARIDADTEQLARCREHLEGFIGDAEVATVDGEPVLTYKWSKPTERIDVKALREKDPALAAQFTVVGDPKRSFRLVDA